ARSRRWIQDPRLALCIRAGRRWRRGPRQCTPGPRGARGARLFLGLDRQLREGHLAAQAVDLRPHGLADLAARDHEDVALVGALGFAALAGLHEAHLVRSALLEAASGR